MPGADTVWSPSFNPFVQVLTVLLILSIHGTVAHALSGSRDCVVLLVLPVGGAKSLFTGPSRRSIVHVGISMILAAVDSLTSIVAFFVGNGKSRADRRHRSSFGGIWDPTVVGQATTMRRFHLQFILACGAPPPASMSYLVGIASFCH